MPGYKTLTKCGYVVLTVLALILLALLYLGTKEGPARYSSY